MLNSLATPDYLRSDRPWIDRLRQINFGLFCLLPLLLLFWRSGADAAASIIALSFIMVVTAQHRWALAAWPLLATPLLIWLILNIVVSPLALQPIDSFSRSVVWVRLPLLFVATVLWLVQSPRDLKIILIVWSVTLTLTILDGLVQLYTGTSLSGRPIWDNRLTGPLDRPNIGMFTARMSFPLLAAAALLLIRRPSHWLAWLGLVMAGLTCFTFVFLTGERAAATLMLLSILSLIATIILVMPRYRIYGILAGVGTSAVIAGVVMTSERIWQRVEALIAVVRDIGASHYGELFRAGLRIWQEYPLEGAGMKNFQFACNAIARADMMYECPQHPHNPYIEWLAETGLAGSIGYAVFVIMLVAGALPLLGRRPKMQLVGACVIGALVLLLFPFTASQSIFSNWPALVFWTSLALTLAVARLTLRETP